MNRWARLRQLSRIVSEYAVAQALIQALGLASGLLLINFLPVQEYALYVLVLSVLTFLSVFSDLGLSSALLYFRRETRLGQGDFAPYVAAALNMRRGLLAAGAVAGLAFVLIVGRERGFVIDELVAVSALMLVAVWVQVSISVGLIALRLESRYRESYLVEIVGNGVRLAGIASMIAASALVAWMAMLTNLAASIASYAFASRGLSAVVRPSAAISPASEALPYRDLARYIVPTSVSAAYFSLQGPLIVWIGATFAGTETIAEVGALGRLGAIMGLVTGFVGTILLPRLSVVTDNKLYLRRFAQFGLILTAISTTVVATAVALPEWFLFLLGSSYSKLTNGFVIVTVSSVLAAWGGYVVAINNARGWIRPQPALVLVFAAIQVLLIFTLNLASTDDVLLFGLLSNAAGFVLHSGVTAAGFLRPTWVHLSVHSTQNALH